MMTEAYKKCVLAGCTYAAQTGKEVCGFHEYWAESERRRNKKKPFPWPWIVAALALAAVGVWWL